MKLILCHFSLEGAEVKRAAQLPVDVKPIQTCPSIGQLNVPAL